MIMPPLTRVRHTTWRALPVLLALVVAGLAAPPASRADDAPEMLDLHDYVQTFNDEFRSLDISAGGPDTRWIAHTPWHGDFGDAVFADPGPDGPFAVTDEGLTISARRGDDGHWRSGLIASVDRDGPGQHGFAQQYGYFEMRAKFPDGPGVWPAFWLIGIDKRWVGSEIDVVEYFGNFPKYMHSWLHLFVKGKDVLRQDHLQEVPSGSLTDRFNDYGVLVRPDRTRFYLNARLIWDMPTPPDFRQPMYMLADLALGGGWPTDKLNSPAVMTIAHIRVFQDKQWLASAGGPDDLRRSNSGQVR